MSDTRRRPEIRYPCSWGYKVLGVEESSLRAAIATVVGAREHRIALSHTSSGGKYLSLEVELTVTSEAERITIFEGLRDHPDTILVL